MPKLPKPTRAEALRAADPTVVTTHPEQDVDRRFRLRNQDVVRVVAASKDGLFVTLVVESFGRKSFGRTDRWKSYDQARKAFLASVAEELPRSYPA